RLMTAALGAWVSRAKGIPLYLDIRDIFVDTIKDVLPRKLAWVMKPLFSLVERWTVLQASRLNVVSEGFLPYFRERYPRVSAVVFTNGIDDQFINLKPDSESSLTQERRGKIEVLYAGNIGEGQGLHNIIPEVAERLCDHVHFRVIGAGGRLPQLRQAVEARQLDNVWLQPPVKRDELSAAYQQADVLFLHLNDYEAFRKGLPSKSFAYGALGKPIWARVAQLRQAVEAIQLDNVSLQPLVKRDELIAAYQQADVLFLHLNDYEAFRKVLPSMLFEYGALGKPIWAGVAGYAAEFIVENLDNASVFAPCDADEAVTALNKLDIADSPRPDFIARYNRTTIMDEMAKDLVAIVVGDR